MSLTKPQIEKKLTKLGIDYDPKALKPALAEKLEKAEKAEAKAKEAGSAEKTETKTETKKAGTESKVTNAPLLTKVEKMKAAYADHQEAYAKALEKTKGKDKKSKADVTEAKIAVGQPMLGRIGGRAVIGIVDVTLDAGIFNKLTLEDGTATILSDRDVNIQVQAI